MKKRKYCLLICIILPLLFSQMSAPGVVTTQNNYNLTYLKRNPLSYEKSKIQQIIEMINESIIKDYLEELVEIGPKMTGSEGCKQAAKYLFEKFSELNLETRYQKWKSLSVNLPVRIYQSENVEATLKGKNEESEKIIYGAHYDTIKVSPGANDDGSGVVAALVAAKILSQFEFNRTIKFVCFSGEEVGILGSRAYVEELYENNEEILVAFNADMIGYAETAYGGKTFRVYPSTDSQWIKEKIKELNTNYGINFNIKGDWILKPGGPRFGSDFHDFLEYGYEVITYFEEETNLSYNHNPEDTVEHINFSYLVNTTKLIIGSIAYFADIEMEYPQVKISYPRHGKLYIKNKSYFDLRYHKIIVFNDILIQANVKPGNSPIEKVEFYCGNKLQFVDTQEPYNWMLNRFSCFIHKVKVIAYDESGKTSSDEISFPYLNLKSNW